MTNTEAIIRTILGPIRRDTRPLACSVDCLSELLFVQKIPMDEIMVTKDIYPEVAKQLNKNPRTISRSVERLVLCCWEEGNRAYLAKIIGRNLTTLREPQGNAVLSLRLFSLECPVFHRCPGAALPVVLRYNPFYCNGSLIKMAIHFLHFHQVSGRFQVIFPASHRSSP